MRVAAIDIGTNSVLLLVAEQRDGVLVAVSEHATITRLGQDVDASGRLAPEAVERTLACLGEYAGIMASSEVSRVAAVGTSAMRDARGGESFVERAQGLIGVAPEVISGEREAHLTFGGSLTGLSHQGPVAVFDVGGGSTEIIVGRAGDGHTIEHAVSLDIGAVRLTERHVKNDPPTAAELERIRADVREMLTAAPQLSGRPLVGVAGTVTTLAAIVHAVAPYDGAALHGKEISRTQVATALELLTSLPLAERRKLPALPPKRADVIIAGALIVDELCAFAQTDAMIVSDRGVRWGVARQLLG